MVTIVAACGPPQQQFVPVDIPGGRGDAGSAGGTSGEVLAFFMQGNVSGIEAAIASASFWRQAATETVLATIDACTTSMSGTPSAGPISAGTITLQTDRVTVTLIPTTSGNGYTDQQLPVPAWTAGHSVHATAVGTPEYPGFSLMATAPAALAGYTPPSSLSRSHDYTVTWTPAGGAHVSIVLSAGSPPSYFLRCVVDDTGSYTVPASALETLPPASKLDMIVDRYAEVRDVATKTTLLVTTAIDTYPLSVTLTP